MTSFVVFISAVSTEFEQERRELASSLRRAGWRAIFHDELHYGRETLMADLRAEISQAAAIVLLLGERSGTAFPRSAAPVDNLPPLPPAMARASYTQWEFLLAGQQGARRLVYRPTTAYRAAHPLGQVPQGDDAALQASFADWIKGHDTTRTEFDSIDQLCRLVLEQLGPGGETTPTHGLPPSLGTRFVGRDDFMDRLRQSLTTTGTTAITAAITGMGGVGKTRVAAEYAWANQDRYHDALLMIPAESAEAIQSNLSALTTPLGLPGMEQRPVPDRVAAVLGWLRARRDWLLILDHVDTESGLQAAYDLRGAVPTGHILLTTRQGTVPDGFADLALDVLSPQASVALLLGATAGKRAMAADDDAQAAALAAALGHLALALTHAAAHIARHGLGFAAYRAELDRRFEAMLAVQGKSVRDHTDSTLATLEISLGRATPAGLALLERLAFLADEPVPRFLLDVKVPGAEAEDLREAEADLADYSLLTRDMVTDVLTTHRLVRELVRRRLTPEAARTRREQALRWVNAAFVGNPQDVRTWPRLLPLAEHAEVVALAAEKEGIDEPTGRLMGALDMLFDARAQYGRAERMSRAALAIGERSLGPDHPEVATRLNNLAGLLKATNRLSEAEPLYRRALAIDEASLGPDHPTVAIRLNNLASLLEATNRLSEAEPLYRRALVIDEASLGPDHPNVAIRLNNLANLLSATNRLSEAEPLSRRMVLIFLKFQRATGHAHPHRDAALGNYAGILEALGRTQSEIIAELRALLAEAGLEGL